MRADGQLHAEHSQCVQEGRVEAAQCVDHIFGHHDDPGHLRFYDEDRLQSLCLRCNNRKRALEEGGFGR
jgi:5-methylcytosine-specific restriction endonuclease McrA